MYNVLLENLPEKWKEYPIETDFRIGIMISQCMKDQELTKGERICTAVNLLFPDTKNSPCDLQEAVEGIQWYLNGWNHDNHSTGKKTSKTEIMDFDVDQWRIYAAFKSQYSIDLNREEMHFWTFMGLLSCLGESSFTQVLSIRSKPITSKMSNEEKQMMRTAKKIYSIEKNQELEETEEEKAEYQEAVDAFNKLRGNC